MDKRHDRHVLFVTGSENDLEQCVDGNEYLEEALDAGMVGLVQIEVLSAHRNPQTLRDKLYDICHGDNVPDVIVAGAGWFNALTGAVWGWVRHEWRLRIPIIGVAFKDLSESPDATDHDQAAVFGCLHVPGTKGDIIYVPEQNGENGYLKAVRFAAEADLPTITLPEPREPKSLTLAEALQIGREQQARRRA